MTLNSEHKYIQLNYFCKINIKLLKSKFSYRQYSVFIARQCLLFLVSIAGTTGMNMSVENNMLHNQLITDEK